MPVNDFLKQFVDMRRQIAPTPAAAASVLANPPLTKKAKKGSKTQEVTDATISYILEQRPPKKEVGMYFQKLCDELTAAKMA